MIEKGRGWLLALRDSMPALAPGQCRRCGSIAPSVYVDLRAGDPAPAVSVLLNIIKLDDGWLKGCPGCGALFRSSATYDLEGAHQELATLGLARITGASAVAILEAIVQASGGALQWREVHERWSAAQLPRVPRPTGAAGDPRDTEATLGIIPRRPEAEVREELAQVAAARARAIEAREAELRGRMLATGEALTEQEWSACMGSLQSLSDGGRSIAWALPLIERSLREVPRSAPELLVECVRALFAAHGLDKDSSGWISIVSGDHPVLGRPGLRVEADWRWTDEACPACKQKETLVFYRDDSYSDPSYEHITRIAEVECTGCKRFALKVYREESRN